MAKGMNYVGCRRLIILSFLLATLAACSSFQKQPPAIESGADSNLFRFVFTGDSRGDYRAKPPVYLAAELLAKMTGNILALEPKPDFVIFNGDMVAKTTFAEAPEKIALWRAIFQEALQARNIKVYITPGNHDLDQEEPCAGDEICYVDRFNKYFQADNPVNGPAGYEGVSYSFTRANTHFVTVSSFTTHNGRDNTELAPDAFMQKKKNFEYFVNEPNREWLRQDLAKDNSTFTIFFTHSPPFPVGPHYADQASLHAYPANRDELVGILAADRVDALLASHEHLYARANIGPGNPDGSGLATELPQIIVGSISAPLDAGPPRLDMKFEKYLPAYSFLVADVKKDRIECRVYNENNEQIDAVTISPNTLQ